MWFCKPENFDWISPWKQEDERGQLNRWQFDKEQLWQLIIEDSLLRSHTIIVFQKIQFKWFDEHWQSRRTVHDGAESLNK